MLTNSGESCDRRQSFHDNLLTRLDHYPSDVEANKIRHHLRNSGGYKGKKRETSSVVVDFPTLDSGISSLKDSTVGGKIVDSAKSVQTQL